jgi:hypothetical protein
LFSTANRSGLKASPWWAFTASLPRRSGGDEAIWDSGMRIGVNLGLNLDAVRISILKPEVKIRVWINLAKIPDPQSKIPNHLVPSLSRPCPRRVPPFPGTRKLLQRNNLEGLRGKFFAILKKTFLGVSYCKFSKIASGREPFRFFSLSERPVLANAIF